MKIALVTPGFSASESDWCIPALLDLVRLLARQHEVHVFTLRYPPWSGKYRVYGATVWSMGADERAGLHRAPLLASTLRAIWAETARAPFDVIHGFWADEPGFLAALAGRLLGIPSLVSVMGGELVWLPNIPYGAWRPGVTALLSLLALRLAGGATVGSYALGRLARQRFPAVSFRQQPLGVDTHRFQAGQTAANSSPRLLTVGSLVAIKDHLTLLEAFRLVRKDLPGARLTIAGDGPLGPMLMARTAALGIEDGVRFLGGMDHTALLEEYQRADLHVVSSRFESQSMVTLEAAACGLPTAGTPVGILPQLTSATVAAATGDPSALAAAIVSALDRRSATARQARPEVAASYSLNITVDRLVRGYQLGQPRAH